MEDFSHDHLGEDSLSVLQFTIDHLNRARDAYLETKDKDHWWQMIQLLPSSYNQKRTVMLNYEVLAGIYPMRKNHKLDEWAEHETKLPAELVKVCNDALIDVGEGGNGMFGFCDWIKTLPYSELITGSNRGKRTELKVEDISYTASQILPPNAIREALGLDPLPDVTIMKPISQK